MVWEAQDISAYLLHGPWLPHNSRYIYNIDISVVLTLNPCFQQLLSMSNICSAVDGCFSNTHEAVCLWPWHAHSCALVVGALWVLWRMRMFWLWQTWMRWMHRQRQSHAHGIVSHVGVGMGQGLDPHRSTCAVSYQHQHHFPSPFCPLFFFSYLIPTHHIHMQPMWAPRAQPIAPALGRTLSQTVHIALAVCTYKARPTYH